MSTRKHTFVPSTYAVVRLEDLNVIAQLRADLIADYKPANSQELFALERLALAQQDLMRCTRLANGFYTASLNEALDPDGRPLRLLNAEVIQDVQITVAQNRNFALYEGFSRLNRKSDDCKLFLRLQAQAERLYRRAAEEFKRIRAMRGTILPDDPVVDSEPPPPVFDMVPPTSSSPPSSPASSDEPHPEDSISPDPALSDPPPPSTDAHCPAPPPDAEPSGTPHPPRSASAREPAPTASAESVPNGSNRSTAASHSPSRHPGPSGAPAPVPPGRNLFPKPRER